MARLTAEEKAKNLLLQHLTPEQRQMFLKKGYFDFTGSKGTKFRLVSGSVLTKLNKLSPHNATTYAHLWRLGGNGIVMAYNIWAVQNDMRKLPEGDNLLAIKLEMEVDESRTIIACNFLFNADLLPKLEK